MNPNDIFNMAASIGRAQVAAAQAAHDARQPEVDRLKKALRGVLDTLRQCEEYFENRADADGDSQGFRPNKEMSLLVEVRATIAMAERAFR